MTALIREIEGLDEWVEGHAKNPCAERVVYRGGTLTAYVTQKSGVPRVAVTPPGARWETLSVAAASPTATENIQREFDRQVDL